MKLYVGGMHLGGAGYPNAGNTLALLRNESSFDVVELGAWLSDDLRLWSVARGGKLQLLFFMMHVLWGNLLSLCKVFRACFREAAPVYVPYPSLFFLYFVSLLPSKLRPFCIADAYISVWDSMFRDRGGAQSDGFIAGLVRRIEARSLRAAAVVLVDTQANKTMFIESFGLSADKVLSLPLAIDDKFFNPIGPVESVKKDSVITVLFVGTLIPLHGISVLLDAVRLLSLDKRFSFRFVGDGQLSGEVEAFVEKYQLPQFVWLRAWCSLEQIACEISNADICLGVFGGAEKAARVLPFKLYMYLAAGRAVITQALLSVPESTPFPPVLTVAPVNAESLADAILKLADDVEFRCKLAQESKVYFREWLSNARVFGAWINDIAPRFSER